MFGLYRATIFLCILFLFQTYSQRIQVIYEGQNVAFYCNATGGSKNDYIHYQWEVNNRDLIATDAYFHIRGIQKSDEGEYKCIATQYINGTPIVATESTFISVRKADSIITQDVEEGILVRILCNVSSDEKPDGAGPFRYEWRNPNGTLVGTQWKLELGHIKVHESGIYVCRVSYEFDKRQMSTSSATKINVIPRAGVIFPGIRGNVLEVLETGDILQECQVVSAKPSQYNFQWFGPDGRLISNSAFLQRDYITRQRDEGIYRCVASPVEEGRLQVENNLIVTTAPLRFQITTIEEDLNIGGFTHRRIVPVDPSKPNLTTRETFIYQWLDTEMNPILDSMGPDLRIKFQSPSDFGRYSVRITGLNSGYQRDLSTYITMDGRNGEVEPTYSVVIREISGPLYLNARLELECSPRPPNSAARINWLGPDGMVVSDSSNIVFERFQPHHQGRYTCQILLPNQIILRQSVELVVSGTSTEIPEPDRLYTIRIIQSPTYFRYNDAVHLQCIVSPTPPLVSYEWFKDGVLIGRQADIHIQRFSPDDVGRYQCVARFDSMVLTFNSTISIDDGTGVDLIMRPNIIYIPAFHPFEIECLSIRTGLSPIAIFGNGAPIESDNRFTIIKPNEQRLIIKATDGLSSVYNGLRIRCMLPGLNYKEVTLYIMDICTASQSQCRTRQCIQTSSICDGKADCLDKSDEGSSFCNAGLTVIPTRIVVKPSEPFSLKCQTILPGTRMPHARFVHSGQDVESDPRFIIERSPGILLIKAPYGLSVEANDTRIECYFPDESPRTAIINVVTDRCGLGYFMCYDGNCIQQSQRCDGQTQCPDGSDEINCVCQPPSILCSSGECITPEMRCDGTQHCRDGTDEIGCPPRCRPGQYQCSSGECIEQQMRCDGRQDCRDASDETGCPPRCRPGQYQCSSGECIEQQMRCDGRQDCRDASDETGCPPRCRPGQYQCSSGECIEQQMRCDGRQDCRDASDETGCPPRCRPGQYQCSSGECIEQQMRCDGRQDCRDASDETGCRERVNVRVVPDIIHTQPYEKWKFECSVIGADVEPIVKFQDGRLVESDPNFRVTRIDPNTVSVEAIHGLTEKKERLSFICTFPGGPEEEIDVYVRRRCPHGEFMCKDGTCRPESDFCNGQVNCPDGSDERPPYCKETIQVEVKPSIIHVQPYRRFEFECISYVPGIKPEARLPSGILVSQDPRFNVVYLSPNHLQVNAIYGLTDRDHPFQIYCIFPGLENRTAVIEIERPCPSGQFQCMDGRCLPSNVFCDGKSDCSDSSDENERYCAVNIRVTPGSIRVVPYQRFQFECSTSIPGVSPQVTFDERSVERDNRFVVTRPSLQTIVVTAPTGLSEIGAHKFKCIVSVNIVKEVDVEIVSECPPGQLKCRSGECLPRAVFCDGKYDCPDRSDEDPRSCVPTIIITPTTILTRPHESFQFECKSVMPGGEPKITLEGYPIENDPRFTIERPSREHVIVRAENGIADPGKYSFTCTVVSTASKTIVVQVESVCPPGYSKCKDGMCIPDNQFCDGIIHCRDGSDEDKLRCPEVAVDVRVHFTPGELRIQPGRAFRLECVTDKPGTSPVLQFLDGRPITSDPRFVVSRPSTERAIIDVPGGLDARDRQIIIECVSPSGERKTSTIFIELGCQPGQRRCPSGQCIFVGQFCDGKPDCDDGFDEKPENCEYCDPITKPCEVVNGKPPKEKTYELHWRCDGEDDCGNRFDEQNCLNDTRVPDKECGATHFRCGTEPYQYIPFAYWCDGGRDCRGGEDEADCSPPTIIQTQRQETHRVRPGGRLILECEASGVPPPMIIWRFNWRCLRDETRMRTQAVPSSLGCKGSKSRLTIENFREGDDGIYNCEALTSKERAMSQDIFVFLSP
ncbi:unnamed protein product [Schistosoma margrebowiei]|uniref:Ig-like domain-containing protein n=1 Tax=Schistosoma margrebowiei TaxID=48269 RepID=A0AA84Z6U2_9TREM|nr:unnamed protein product [Schistosoma margrebowiei]CAH8661938.1 unnamed protein product [Schistosoma margrebowiei]